MATTTIENKQDELKAFKALCEEFRTYIGEIKIKWDNHNRPPQFRHVYEVLEVHERKQIDDHINCWDRYIKPIAEEWWGKHGYGVNWPDDNSKPVGYYKL